MVLFGLFLLLTSSVLNAGDSSSDTSKYQSLEVLHSEAMEFLKQKVDQKLIEPQIQLKKLNPRIQLPACQASLEFIDRTPSKLAGRTTIGIKCPQPSWQTFVSAYIDGKLSVVVSTQGILKQAVIKKEDIALENIHFKSVPNDALISIDTAIGMRAKKAISANTVLTLRNLQPPYWVFKKQPVRIITKIGQIEISARGIALEDGVENQQVDIKNISSQKTIRGIVIAPNTVMVP
ncbi:MAG: flagellar basal body P-ring formation protein FlgA [Thiotrichales bacterium]|nr:flagellar basal body P-ring formation protein FlgA [Thiotrichales bacterium]